MYLPGTVEEDVDVLQDVGQVQNVLLLGDVHPPDLDVQVLPPGGLGQIVQQLLANNEGRPQTSAKFSGYIY